MLPLLVLLLLTGLFCYSRASCPEKEEPGFCNGGDFFPQMYCYNVYIEEAKWTCARKNKERCVCSAPYYRERDGRCVAKDECVRPKSPTKRPSEPHQDVSEGLGRPAQDPNLLLKFLKNEQMMYLMASTSEMLPGALKYYHVCLRSAYITTTSSGAFRTIGNYRSVLLMGDRILMTTKQGTAEFIMPRPQSGPLMVELKLDINEVSAGTRDASMEETFEVMDLEETCLLLCFAGDGCLLFGYDYQKIRNTKCYETMKKKCCNDIRDLLGRYGPCSTSDMQQKETASGNHPQSDKEEPLGKAEMQLVSTEAVSEFLLNTADIHLQMMNRDEWLNTDCECIKSTFHAALIQGSQRSLECYLPTKVLMPSVLESKVIWREKLTKIEERAEFEAVKENGRISVSAKAIIGLDTTQDPSTYIFPNYNVLVVERGCLLLSYGQSINGKHRCLLWGLSRKEVDPGTECFRQKEYLCAEEMDDVTETDNPCDYYDKGENLNEEATVK